MKKVLIGMIVAAASFAAAQTTATAPASTPPASPKTAPAAQAPASQAPGSNPPAAQAPAGQPAPAQGRTMPQAKSQDEYKAYQDAVAKTTPADTETAADAFAAKFPDSELRPLLYRKAMFDYQNSNNSEKTSAMAKKILALDPNNPEALVTFATVTAQSTRETDLDRDERLTEAVNDATKALKTIDTDLMIPANAPPDRVQAFKNSLLAMAYDALGTVAMVKKDYAAAESNLRKSSELNPQPDPVTWLRLSVALDQQKKYPQALDAANKAVQYSADAPQANNLAKMERDRLQKLVSAGGTAAPAAPTAAPTSPTPTTSPAPGASPGASPAPATSPAPSTPPSKPPQ